MEAAERRAERTDEVLREDADPLIETREQDIVTPDDVDHVNTQIHYALLAGSLATLLFPASGSGIPALSARLVGVAGLVGGAYLLSEHLDIGRFTVYDTDADLGVSED